MKIKLYKCPNCLGNQHFSNNVKILCRWCRGTGKVDDRTRTQWRLSLPDKPIDISSKNNSNQEINF